MTDNVDQNPPTAPRKVDAQGRELDQWNLPLNGPARIRALAELGKPDPNVEPGAWSSTAASPGKAKAKTETENG